MAEQQWVTDFGQYLLVQRQYSPLTQQAYLEDIADFTKVFACNG